MDLLLICRDALENSIITNLLTAAEAKRAGLDVGVLFTEEALAALAGESCDWSPLLRNRNTRVTIASNAQKLGMPIYEAPTRSVPAVASRELMRLSKEAGVRLFACATWIKLLGLAEDKLAGFEPLEPEAKLKILRETKTVIGSL